MRQTPGRPGSAGRYPAAVTQPAQPARRTSRVRRTALVLASSAVLVTLPGRADADVPENWSNPAPVDGFELFLIIAAIPVVLALLITLVVALPGLMRGEGLTSGPPVIDSQWLGGPSKTTDELAGPDDADSQAGGASARW